MREIKYPIVSIIIASHRKRCIGQCVKSIVRLTQGLLSIEIIVVADYPLEEFETNHPEARWISHPEISISAKRNLGIAHARGALVGFIDDDCLPQSGWIQAAVKFLEQNPTLAGFTGQTLVEWAPGKSYPVNEYKRLESPGYRTNNIFYKKDILTGIGGFDTRFTVQREDVDLAFSILEKGETIGHCPNCTVQHLHRAGERWDLLKNCINRRFDPLLFRKHPALYRRWIKTPCTPSIAAMLAVHGLLGAAVVLGFSAAAAVAGDMAFALALSARRNRHTGFHGAQIARDWLSYWVSPFVLFGALMYGSAKFGALLIF
jgi:glycosyltransferase involved in cell wall biosynthesis